MVFFRSAFNVKDDIPGGFKLKAFPVGRGHPVKPIECVFLVTFEKCSCLEHLVGTFRMIAKHELIEFTGSDPGCSTLDKVHAAADEMIDVFHQSSVLIQANETTTEFYAGNNHA